MIGRRRSERVKEDVERKGFDDFELRLGDVMRGERATMGKSLLDVQRELRIKAAYIAAIENCDPDAFDTPGFIAGYVRSYARYLGMNPDDAFETFCTESGFAVAHGMSSKASVVKKPGQDVRAVKSADADMFNRPGTPFVPTREGFFSGIEPSAVGSSLLLLALIGAIGFGGYSVLQEVQRVQVAPVEQTPIVLSDLDPLDGVLTTAPSETSAAPGSTVDQPRAEALDRLYRPQALDVPVLVARDAPISTIDPSSFGSFAQLRIEEDVAPPRESLAGAIDDDIASALDVPAPVPQVVEEPGPALRMVAVRPSWVRVTAADGTVIFETIMEPGDTWDAPSSEVPPTLRTGESGAIYFALSGEYFGPVGETGAVTSNLPLAVDELKARYAVADLAADEALATTVVELQTPLNTVADQ
ncbi:4-hydroxy-3-methylbut-2-en-1-yl diphosphate synthase [Roseobacter cerasinus]|uniref:4-hydroxy-3-methylbut-2-en-1-yl diphosphate synthase n=1 Tax=Roseobacter cerasinus TaxID=2602289 RepID=A0A640VTT5_9RHOB|nr:helix-turn-helix domain-containing protein [Roseobacter cerasinus]GFE50305.1 4-hydroxy-3-methylbut-2-en-1-yl diphosphate synthase [Roseobacter cerasinus]